MTYLEMSDADKLCVEHLATGLIVSTILTLICFIGSIISHLF